MYVQQEGAVRPLATTLQIGESTSFVPNSLSVPASQHRRQVLLHGHLLPVATVAVGEDPVRVSFGQGLRLVLHAVVFTGKRRRKKKEEEE